MVSRNASFAEDVAQRGHIMAFEKDDDDKPKDTTPTDASRPAPFTYQPPAPFGGSKSNNTGPSLFKSSTPNTTGPAFGSSTALDPASSGTIPPTKTSFEAPDALKSVRERLDFSELEDINFPDEKIARPKVFGIKAWLKTVYAESRGFELGTFDASILPVVWKKQSGNWDALGLGYISDIITIVHRYTQDLLRALCKDERVLQAIEGVLLDHLTERYKKSIDHATFILTVERSGTPLTTNHYFTDNLEKSRDARTKAQLEKSAFWDPAQQSNVVKLEAIMTAKSNSSNEDQTIDDLHDILKSYYKVARKRFVDVMCMQAADFHLVTGPDAPTKVFSPTFVGGLSTEQLAAIAGEDLLTKRKRGELTRKIENLEIGKKIALA